MIGRYHKIRAWNPRTNYLSAPLILDRKWWETKPYLCEEWWKSPRGIWQQTQHILTSEVGTFNGGATGNFPQLMIGFSVFDWGSTTFSLNSSYTAGTGGAAVSGRFCMMAAKTITAIYFWLDSFTGTASLVDDLNVELRTESSTFRVPTTTAGGLKDSGSVNPLSTVGWTKASLSGTLLTVGTLYHVIVGDADGGGTNYAVVSRGSSAVQGTQPVTLGLNLCCSTTDGWIGITTQQRIAQVVAIFNDGTAFGDVFIAVSNPPADTNRKGFYIGGVTEQLTIYGITQQQTLDANHSIELYAAATNPGGTTLATGTAAMGNSAQNGFWLTAPYTLAKATPYRLVFTSSSGNVKGPVKHIHSTLGTGASAADLNGGMPGQGGWYYAGANGTTNWSNDDVNGFPQVALFIGDQVAVAAAATSASGIGPMINAGSGGGLIQAG